MSQPVVLIIFGATGDLALRMLFPSLYHLDCDDLLAPDISIIGASRSKLERDTFRMKVARALDARVPERADPAIRARFESRLLYRAVDALDGNGFDSLGSEIDTNAQVIFYLSTSPDLYGAICGHLKRTGLAKENSRIVVEKPIGHDLASSRAINDFLAET